MTTGNCIFDKSFEFGAPLLAFYYCKKRRTRCTFESIRAHRTVPLSIKDLSIPDGIKVEGKYNDFVPPVLLRKQYAAKYIDIVEMQQEMPTVRKNEAEYKSYIDD